MSASSPWDRLREPAAGICEAEEEVGDRASPGLTGEPHLQDRGSPVHHVDERHDAAVAQDRDHSRVHLRHGLDELALRDGQVDVGAVGALRLSLRGQAEEDHHHLRVAGRVEGPGQERLVAVALLERVPGREHDRAVGHAPDRCQRVVEPGGGRRASCPRPGSEGVRASSPMTATAPPLVASGSRPPSLARSTALSAATRRASAWWAWSSTSRRSLPPGSRAVGRGRTGSG